VRFKSDPEYLDAAASIAGSGAVAWGHCRFCWLLLMCAPASHIRGADGCGDSLHQDRSLAPVIREGEQGACGSSCKMSVLIPSEGMITAMWIEKQE
jgi:hypothetical protein